MTQQPIDSNFARRIVAGYCVAQALSTLCWWGCLIWLPRTIDWFQPAAWPDAALLSFWLPDMTMIVAGSLTVAWAVSWQKPWASMAVWSLAAAVWYATLYCIGVSLSTGQAWIAAALMTCMAGLSLAMATIYGNAQQAPATFRTTPMRPSVALRWSLIQLVIFWSVFLWILPMGLQEFQHRALEMHNFAHVGQRPVAIVLFLGASTVGLWSCLTLAMQGEGTPLPTANAPKLVAAGPYRFVRNPMAVAGIWQGLAVGWYLGSVCVLAYAFLGALAWHVCVRPFEEAELSKRFGEAYDNYRKAVPLWFPFRGEPLR